jgi:hypothetical protein
MGDARLEHRRPNRAGAHDLGCELWVDSAAFGEQQAVAKGEGLHREADVDGELEQRASAVDADVCDCLAELAQQRLNRREGLVVYANRDRQRSGRGLGRMQAPVRTT